MKMKTSLILMALKFSIKTYQAFQKLVFKKILDQSMTTTKVQKAQNQFLESQNLWILKMQKE